MTYVETFLKNKQCSDIIQNDMKSLSTDMKTKYQNSTFANVWVMVKSFITFGIHNNKINGENLFATIKVVKRPKPVEYLTIEEVDRLRTTQYTSPRLKRVADFAILEINLGLAYCDLVDIKREDIQQHGDTLYIKKKRMKTNVEYISIVTDEALSILEKYDYNISITNQCYNRYLKQVGEQARIDRPMHSHIFRHTFAHQQLNEKHLNISTVSKMLGHTNLKQTQHYCQKHTSTILEEFVQATRG
jgi:site-specific recombinase XerD